MTVSHGLVARAHCTSDLYQVPKAQVRVPVPEVQVRVQVQVPRSQVQVQLQVHITPDHVQV